jgi:hypothetical protein
VAANPVSAEQAEKLTAFVRRWQQLLNLNDWRITRSPQRKKGVMADLPTIDLEQRLAIYRVGTDFGMEAVDDTSLEATALHEVLHVLLAELIEAAKNPETPADTLRSVEHRVINTLERLLLRKEQ